MEPPWPRSTSKHGVPKGSLAQSQSQRETSIEHANHEKARNSSAAIPSRPQKIDGHLTKPGVLGWLDGVPTSFDRASPATPGPQSEPCSVSTGGSHLDQDENHGTVNKFIPGQRYFVDDGKGGAPTPADRALMRETMPWNDPPRALNIHTPRGKDSGSAPESSQAAISKFEAMAMENQSVVSEVATCGTHLLGLQPAGEISSVAGGNLLRKISFKQPTTTPVTRVPLSEKHESLKFELHLAPELLEHSSSAPPESQPRSIRENAPPSKVPKATDRIAKDHLIMDQSGGPSLLTPQSFRSLEEFNPRDIPEVRRAKSISKASVVSKDNLDKCSIPETNMISQPSQVATNIVNNSQSQGRQVGTAKIRVELLSLTWAGENSDSLDSEGGEEDSDDDMLENKENEEPGNSSENGRESGAGQWYSGNGSGTGDFTAPTDGQGGGSSRSQQELKNNGKRGGGGGNNPNKRRRVNPPDGTKTPPRLACPYQAFEKSLHCFKPGALNRHGGCKGISRLRQHLQRKHMLSFRCPTCWKSFDTKAKIPKHIKDASCQHKPKEAEERFMETNQETEVDDLCLNRTLSDKDTWWQLFRRLIPGMDSMDDESWATWREHSNYSPYYPPGEISFSIPGLGIANVPFPQSQPGPSDPLSGTTSLLTSQSYSQDPGPSYTSTMAPITQSATLMSQILSLPVFESVSDLSPHNYILGTAGQPYDPHAFSENDFVPPLGLSPRQENLPSSQSQSQFQSQIQSQSQSQIQSQTTISQSSSHTSLSSPPGASTYLAPSMLDPLIHNTPHNPPANNHTPNTTSTHPNANINQILRQNNERQRTLRQRAEAEIAELRDANRAVGADVNRAEEIIMDLLLSAPVSSGPLDPDNRLQSGLQELLNLMETVREKLRKAS